MEDLAIQIQQFVPDAAGEELEHRISLYKARDHAAMLRGQSTILQAFQLACDAHEAAGEFLYADMAPDRLKLAATYVRNLVHAAFLAEQLLSEGV